MSIKYGTLLAHLGDVRVTRTDESYRASAYGCMGQSPDRDEALLLLIRQMARSLERRAA